MIKGLVLASAASLLGISSLSATGDEASSISTTHDESETQFLRDGVALIPVDPEELISQAEVCGDRITKAREATGQSPILKREPASPDKPLAIYAVHREQDGCSVMVMMGNPGDIRPLPAPMEGSSRMIPAQLED